VRDIDILIQSMNAIYPTVRVRQLEVSHPGADDDGLWFFQEPESKLEVQIESSTGMCPFLVETNESQTRVTATTMDQAIAAVARLLHLGT
jgi:hypothetical protein